MKASSQRTMVGASRPWSVDSCLYCESNSLTKVSLSDIRLGWMTKVSLSDLRWEVQKFEIRHKYSWRVGLMKDYCDGIVSILKLRTTG